MIKLFRKINCLGTAMHGKYFGYLASLFFRFGVFLSCESGEICKIDRQEAEFIVKSPEVSVFFNF